MTYHREGLRLNRITDIVIILDTEVIKIFSTQFYRDSIFYFFILFPS
jgi:hypothetical protein